MNAPNPSERPYEGAYHRVVCEWVGGATRAQVQCIHTDNFDLASEHGGPRDYWCVARPDEDALWFRSEAEAKAWIEENLPGGAWEEKDR